MRIDEEIKEFLSVNTPESETKRRNIELFLFLYGFRGVAWPTLAGAAKKYAVGSGKNPRERPRQISQKFKDLLRTRALPSVLRCAELIKATQFRESREMLSELESRELIPKGASLIGVLNLLHDLSTCRDYDIYTSELDLATRNSYDESPNLFVVRNDVVADMQRALKIAFRFPGRVGVAKLSNLKNQVGKNFSNFDGLVSLLKSNDKTWFFPGDRDGFYLIEHERNTLINSLKKIKNVTDVVRLDQLATTLKNSLYRRTAPKGNEYPDDSIIKQYLIDSPHATVYDTQVRLDVQPTALNPIEHDVVSYLSRQKVTDFSKFSRFLEDRKYKKPHIEKTMLHSPLVFVDRSKRGSYTYRLIGSSDTEGKTVSQE